MKSVIFVVLLGLALGLDCTTYTCGDLETDVCASYSEEDDQVTFNENGCESDSVCSLTLALAHYVGGGDSVYECVSTASTTIDERLDVSDSTLLNALDEDGALWAASAYCNSDSDLDLKEGSFPKECDEASDCELMDGTNAACVCGLEGTAYCEPDFYSAQASADWFDLCESEDANSVYYTYYYTQNYLNAFLQDYDEDDSDYECLEDSVYEFGLWKEAEDNYDDEEDDSAIYRVAIGAILALVIIA